MSRLAIVTYHYVRNLPETRFPRIRGLMTDDFRRQVDMLSSRYEMATWESAMAFVRGEYAPKRDMCYLTFDDGLKDHYSDVLPILDENSISAGFYVITGCLIDGWVATVHKNHFLLAELEFEDLYARFVSLLGKIAPEVPLDPDAEAVAKVYRWDEPRVANYKYMVNYGLPIELREQVLDALFKEVLGDEVQFANELYVSWNQLMEMQDSGMSIGTHSHRHRSLSSLDLSHQEEDLKTSYEVLAAALPSAGAPAYCYPYGKRASFSEESPDLVRRHGFSAAMTSIPEWNYRGADPYLLKRFDTNDVARM